MHVLNRDINMIQNKYTNAHMGNIHVVMWMIMNKNLSLTMAYISILFHVWILFSVSSIIYVKLFISSFRNEKIVLVLFMSPLYCSHFV